MSEHRASEKLKALATRLEPLSYVGAGPTGQAKADVLNALPQIISVLEVAENLAGTSKHLGGRSANWPLQSALDDLEKSLP